MNSQWQDFLARQGARWDADGSVRIPGATGFAPEDTKGSTLFELSHLGLIAARGEEADSFLQGQLTNDIRELSPTHTQLNGHCSPKGRILASFRVLRLGDTIYLQLPRERVPETLKRLRLFVLRAKVTLEDASDALVRIGIAGNGTLKRDFAERLGAEIRVDLDERHEAGQRAGCAVEHDVEPRLGRERKRGATQ